MKLSIWQIRFLYFFVFITGASVMAIEIAASRVLAPYFGNSMFVWAIIITIIMLGLAIGYWWGGKVADRFPQKHGLFLTSLGAGIFTGFIPLITKFLFSVMEQNSFDSPYSVIGLGFVVALIIFLPAVILLGFISPYTTRVIANKVENIGQIAGNIYAFSTFGSIIGILVTSFLCIPFLGTRETILLFSILLIVISVLGLKKWLYLLVLVVPVLIYFSTQGGIKKYENVVYEKDTLYQFVQVQKKGNAKYLTFDEGSYFQSYFDFAKNLSGTYYDYYVFLPDILKNTNPNIGIIGFAGGVISKEINIYKNKEQNIKVDGIEIDPGVAEIAKKYFNITDKDANIYVSDGRRYLAQTDKKYDALIVDAYSREFYIPFHLTTEEFFTTVKKSLNNGGIVSMNINATSMDSPLLASIAKTVGSVFRNVYINNVVSYEKGGNYLLFASDAEIDFSKATTNDKMPQELVKARGVFAENAKKIDSSNLKGIILTDNRAPLEYLTDHLFFETKGS